MGLRRLSTLGEGEFVASGEKKNFKANSRGGNEISCNWREVLFLKGGSKPQKNDL